MKFSIQTRNFNVYVNKHVCTDALKLLLILHALFCESNVYIAGNVGIVVLVDRI